ncbi:MAG: heme-binding domain-containing protein [Anaerolineales bacterium]|nr:heme-binding domain-containing protein [Anaerolineales bacterium]
MKKVLWILFVALLVICGGILLIRPPIIGHNPPVVSEPQWPSPEVRALAQRACFDCHSNETTWWWYTQIPPFSWLAANDVAEGRATINFSDWQGGRRVEAGELGEVVLEGEMPPAIYLMMHASARLTEAERQTLATGLSALH